MLLFHIYRIKMLSPKINLVIWQLKVFLFTYLRSFQIFVLFTDPQFYSKNKLILSFNQMYLFYLVLVSGRTW